VRANGTFIHLAAQDQRDAEKAAALTRRERWDAELRRALDAGFSEREAPFAVSVRLTRGPATVAVIREHLRAEFPGLYEAAA
jgi:hypothetical protein